MVRLDEIFGRVGIFQRHKDRNAAHHAVDRALLQGRHDLTERHRHQFQVRCQALEGRRRQRGAAGRVRSVEMRGQQTVPAHRAYGVAPDIAGSGLIEGTLRERLKLDGLMSVWQGPGGGDYLPAEGARE